MGKCNLLPKPVKHSFPDLDCHGHPNTAPIEVDNIAALHDAIYRQILPNLTYNYHICECFHTAGLLQIHPDSMVNLIPHIDDYCTHLLLVDLNKKAFHKMWCCLDLYNNEDTSDDMLARTGNQPHKETIWRSLRQPAIRRVIKDFLWQAIHERTSCGSFIAQWGGIWVERSLCD
ncbi:hypothetical protein FRB93_008568, partial [Tulasnella sp. JGI-2019a]